MLQLYIGQEISQVQDTHYSSPTAVTWDYFKIVEMAVSRAKSATDRHIERQEAALAVVMAVNALEVFLNLYFRVLVEEEGYAHHKDYLNQCLDDRKGLEFKIRNWPKKILGVSIDRSNVSIMKFREIKSLRNKIVHFTSSHERIELGDSKVFVNGVANTSDYDALDYEKARHALDSSRSFVAYIALIRGIDEAMLPKFLHGWCGTPI
jgi:hypothetical protein